MPEALVSPAARADLISQCDYFANEVGKPALADRFAANVETTFKKLALTPGLGRVRSFPHPNAAGLRSWQITGFPKHLVFYRPLPEGRGVEIIRLVHGARDLKSMFGKEGA